MPNPTVTPPALLLLGDIPLGGKRAPTWDAFAAAAGSAEVAIVDASGDGVDLETVTDWLRTASPRPEVVVIGVGNEASEMALLGAGVAEVLGHAPGAEAVEHALRRAVARGTAAAQTTRFRRSLLVALPDVISRIRRDGLVLDFHVPPVFATEFPPEAMLGRRLHDEIPAPLAKQFDDAVRAVENGHDEPVTYRYAVMAEGVQRYREVRIVPHGPDEVISILRDVTPEVEAEIGLRQSTADLEASQAELRALAAHLQDVREEERTYLSREVHDTLGQQLTAIRFAVGWFGRQLPGDADAQQRLADARALIDETIQQVRSIAADLRPGVLDDFGLVTALEWLAERTAERTGLRIEVAASGDARGVPDEVATAAFRIVQEALTNVARHAGATSVHIAADAVWDNLEVRVEDDGVGLDTAAIGARRSLGVLGMRERARVLGGTLVLSGTPGQGATVTASFPLTPAPA